MMRALCAGLVTFILLFTSAAGSVDANSGTERFRVVFSADVFASVNRNDALASAKAWIQAVGKRRKIDLKVEVDAYESVDELRQLLAGHGADLFVVSAMHFLDLESASPAWDPLFVPGHGEFVLDDYVLLTRADGPATVGELRGADVLVLKTTGTNLGSIWLARYCADNSYGPARDCFASITNATKASGAVLPVYFGQADACVVDRSSFDLMTELNPQLASDLTVRAQSAPFLETVICLRRDYQAYRQDVVEGLKELHTEPAGQQIMMVFKIERLIPFSDELLESVRILRGDIEPLEAASR